METDCHLSSSSAADTDRPSRRAPLRDLLRRCSRHDERGDVLVPLMLKLDGVPTTCGGAGPMLYEESSSHYCADITDPPGIFGRSCNQRTEGLLSDVGDVMM